MANYLSFAPLPATGGPSSSSSASVDVDPSNSRVKRHPKRNVNGQANGTSSNGRRRAHTAPHDTLNGTSTTDDLPTSPPPSYASVASGHTPTEKAQATTAKLAIIDTILHEEDLYKLLGVKRSAKPDEIRRGFLNRSRACHPDKFPNHAPATEAFQKVSFAYETLSKPSSRRMYDVSGRTDFAAAMNNDGADGSGGAAGEDTLNSVLYSVFCEFMEGDFEMIRVLVNALNNESTPGGGIHLGDDAVDSIEAAFSRLRDIMLAGKRYLSIIRFELIRLYEIQHSLRQLSYFNVMGRLRLTLQLARVTINIPLAIDQAMKQPQDGQEGATRDTNGTSQDYQNDDDGDSSSDESEDERPSTSRSAPRSAPSDDFGVAPEDDDDDGSDSNEWSESRAEEQARQRRRAKRARRRAAKRERRAKLRNGNAGASMGEEDAHTAGGANGAALQRRGLLPNSAVGLLKGVVRVLEASEAWVPGGGAAAKGSDE